MVFKVMQTMFCQNVSLSLINFDVIIVNQVFKSTVKVLIRNSIHFKNDRIGISKGPKFLNVNYVGAKHRFVAKVQDNACLFIKNSDSNRSLLIIPNCLIKRTTTKTSKSEEVS